jgi:hypothetical protein
VSQRIKRAGVTTININLNIEEVIIEDNIEGEKIEMGEKEEKEEMEQKIEIKATRIEKDRSERKKCSPSGSVHIEKVFFKFYNIS